jgi:acetyltransferase
VPVRPIGPQDIERERRLFARLSQQSRYRRFMQHLTELTPEMLERFTRLDYPSQLALAALEPGKDEFIGVARYGPRAGGGAEFALVVADDWQRRGIGRALLERLARAARDAGYDALYGYVLADNADMLELARRLGFGVVGRDGAELTVARRLNRPMT